MANPSQMNNPGELLDQWKDFRTQVVDYLKSIPESEFNAAPGEGGWSPSQIAEHLYLTQWNMARAVPAIVAGKVGLSADECATLDYDAYEDQIMQTGNAEAPEIVLPKENWDLATCLENLQKAMDKTEKAISGKTTEQLESRGIPHAIFGGVNLMDWMWIQAYHELRHLNALKRKRGDA
ncbi:MAG: DinB family protein [Leptospiraceae bacterium]|nr:DinB family protein [Leptospiraceae bacterium]